MNTYSNSEHSPNKTTRAVATMLISVAIMSSSMAVRPAGANEIEEVLVTGSHIRATGFDTSRPIQTVDIGDIDSIGASQPQDILKNLTANTGSELFGETTSRIGVSQFSLRGLGISSTLTLVNGRRAGVAPVFDPTGSDFVDMNQFPLSMIERIEVLADGASATYGSDAVAGVANIITRKDFEGLELSADYRDAINESYSFSMAVGKGFDNGSFNAYATYYTQTMNDRNDFDWMDKRILGNGDTHNSQMLSSTGAPGSYLRAFINANLQPETLANAKRSTDPDCEAAGGFLVDGRCRHDFSGQYGPIADEERAQLFIEFNYQIADNINYFAEGSFSRNLIIARFGSPFFLNGPVVGSRRSYIPGDHPFNFWIEDPADPTALTYIGPDAWNNAIHTGVDLACECRPFGRETNNNNILGDDRQERIYTRVVNGLEIDLPSDWYINASYQFAHGSSTREWPVGIRADVYDQAIRDGEFNPFGTKITRPDLISPKDGVSTAGNDQETIDNILGISNSQITTTQHVVDAIATKEIVELPAGPANMALGVQYRSLERKNSPDSLDSSSEGFVPGRQQSSLGRQRVSAVFGEVILPVTEWAELQLAVRREEFNSGGSTTDPKIAARIMATDWLSFRASWGSSFQVPTLQQTTESIGLSLINDAAIPGPGPNGAVCVPPGGGTAGQSTEVFISTKGEGLKPQSADNFNFGTIFYPLDDMSLSLDYWRYDYTDLIAPSESAQAIIDNDCADDGIPNDPRLIRDGGGQLARVNTEFTNIGSVIASGVDLAFAYTIPSDNIGGFTLDGAATYIDQFDVDDPVAGTFDGAGSRNFSNNFGPQPQWRANLGLSWYSGIHSANITTRYIDSYRNDQSNNGDVPSFTTVDMQYGIEFDSIMGSGVTLLAVGANNVFDRDPPPLRRLNADGRRSVEEPYERPGYDPRVHDIRGRMIYLRVKHSF